MTDRIEVDFPTRFSALGRTGRGEIKNVSPGGMFISSPATFKVGDRIDVSFQGPGGNSVRTRGVVWWTSKDLQFCGKPIGGFGVRLIDEGEPYRRVLAQLQRQARSRRS